MTSGQQVGRFVDVVQVSWINARVVRANGYSIRNIPTRKMRVDEREIYQFRNLDELFDTVNNLWTMTDCSAANYAWNGATYCVAVTGRLDGIPFFWLLTYQRVILGTLAYTHAIDTGRRLQEPLDWPFSLETNPAWLEWTKTNHPVYPGGRDSPVVDPLHVRFWNWIAPKRDHGKG